MRFDTSVTAAQVDESTVTKAGVRLEKVISGVRTNAPVNHVDHRGRVFEVYSGADSEYWEHPLVYCYAFTVRAGQVKGWGLHQRKLDRYTMIDGEVLTILYDARLDSPTHGLVQRVHLTPQGVRQLTIPTGVWHMNVNLGATEAFLINHPTEVYHHAEPDRLLLAWDSDKIPVELAKFFPIQANGPVDACR